MSRILGIDYGSKRTGIAVTDPLQIIVSPLSVVPTAEAISFIRDYITQEDVSLIVCGDPGQEYAAMHQAVRQFVKKLGRELPDIPIVFQDEKMTSQKASEIIVRSGVKKMQRRDKSRIDQVSAVLILQEYLGHLKDVHFP